VLPAESKFNVPFEYFAKLFCEQASAELPKLSPPELGASTLILKIYFGLFRSQYSKQLAAGLQHAYATDLPLCKSSSSRTSTLPTCIAVLPAKSKFSNPFE